MILRFKFKELDNANIVLVMIGALIPDLFKIVIPLEYLGIYIKYFIYPLHLPVGSLISASLITLLFKEKRIVFLLLIFGIFIHYSLDLLMTYVSGGLTLLFPFSWAEWQLRIISVDDYYLLILAVFVALIVFAVSKRYNKIRD